jgi:hypothetical protein
MAHEYGIFSVLVWWLMVTITLFWKIWFPFDLKIRESKNQIRYIHLGFGLAGLLIPLIPVIIVVAEFGRRNPSLNDFVSGGLGFNIVRYPPVTCAADVKLVLYVILLPVALTLGVGLTLVLLIFWLLRRVSTTPHN